MVASSHSSTLGHLLRERRNELKMTMREVAGRTLSPTAVNNIEKGKIKPSIDTVLYLCEVLQLAPERMLLYYPDFSKSCPVLLQMVDNWLSTGRVEEAITLLYDLYWVACERAEQESHLAEIQMRIGLAFGQSGCYENARQVMRETYNYYRQTNDVSKQILVLNYIGRFLLEEHEMNIAISSYKQAVELIVRSQLENKAAGDTYLNLASAYAEAENLREALYYNRRAHNLFQKINDPDGVSRVLLQQASLLAATEQTTVAFRQGLAAYRHFAASNNGKQIADALCTLGDVLQRRQKYAHAETCYQQAAACLKQHAPQERERCKLDLKLAQLELNRGNVSSARVYAQSALSQASQPRTQSVVYQLLAKAEWLLGQRQSYIAYMNLATEALQKSGDGYQACLLQCELADKTDDWDRMRAATRELRAKYANMWNSNPKRLQTSDNYTAKKPAT